MSDSPKCPHCDSPRISWSKYHVNYECGTKSVDEETDELEQSDLCKVRQHSALLAECVGVIDRMQKLLKRVATPDASSGYQYLDLDAKDDAWEFIESKTLAALKQRIAALKGDR